MRRHTRGWPPQVRTRLKWPRSENAVTNAQLVATGETLRELIEKLLLPKFDRYVSRERREALLRRVASLVEIVEGVTIVTAADYLARET